MNKYAEFSKSRQTHYSLTHHKLNKAYLRGCMTKKAFISEAAANARAKEIAKQDKTAPLMRAYKCPSCHLFHLTSKVSRDPKA